MELSPRTVPGEPGTVAPKRRRRPWAYGVLAFVLVGLSVVVYQGLTSASLYFYNADEASEQRAELGSQRIRLQGSVRDDVHPLASGEGIEFTVTYNGADVVVHHDGDPPELFQPGLPVVLEGRWSPSLETFDSDRILVKHSEQYEADNGDRLDDADDADDGQSGASLGSSTP